ncbi:hypothetical protein V7S43_007980 [Phytophthora oleae]|uniref:Uncharacterized protein n=1 Tax=Phytophthora oleae TaxID=2107226 RepID=A0ABD3FJD2_9STRA
MKRGQASITAFFQRKQARRISIESVDSESDNDDTMSTTSTQSFVVKDIEDVQSEQPTTTRNAMARREAREDLTGILQRREIVGCASIRQLVRGQDPRRRRKQQLVRWALTHFQRLPVELQLAPHWERQAGALSAGTFYASCLEFDSQGVLLAVGASNGIVALYDFDDVFYRSLNLGQKMQMQEGHAEEGEEQKKTADEILYPIHTIFTSFEVKCIRWNPLNEDEVACSFTNRNEIHIFDLRKFPSKPQKVLKSSNQPSCGYNDLLYLPAAESTLTNSRQVVGKAKARPKPVYIIAGDMDGAIRMWDPRSPLRPMWSFLAGSHPINSLLLSPNKQFLVCGNEAGMVMTYDIQHKIVPVFASKPVPQKKATFNIMEAIKPYLSAALIESVILSSRYGSPGIMSMHPVPHSETQVLCQLRNDWVVVIDYLSGSVTKLHTFIRGLTRSQKPKVDASPSVLSTTSENEYQRDFLLRSLRNSWLSCHRCTGTFLFDKSIMCTGIHDATSLNVIDLHQLRRITVGGNKENLNSSERSPAKPASAGRPEVERLDRFRIPTSSIVTAVTAHPSQHAVICGGENMRLQVLGVMGQCDNSTRQGPEEGNESSQAT